MGAAVAGRRIGGLAMAVAIALTAAGPAPAETAAPGVGPETKLPLPRYVSLGSSRVNVRRGPGLDYRRDWEFRRAGLPVRVLDEYGHWRLIEDAGGAGGWVYHALISGRRTVLVTAPGVVLLRRPGAAAAVAERDCAAPEALPAGAVACAEAGVIAELHACDPDWCEIEAGGRDGWVPKTAIWGVDPAEQFER